MAVAAKAPKRLAAGPKNARAVLVFAHGAGAPMDSDFMTAIAKGLAAEGVRVVRFEFPYMAARRAGARKPPDKREVLVETFTKEIARARKEAEKTGARVFAGGKSMGGRIATMIADDAGATGVVCFGYPFWPPQKGGVEKKREDTRIVHLRSLRAPALIVQGTRDEFGGRGEIETLGIRPRVFFSEDGDHDLAPRVRSSGRTHDQNLAEAIAVAAAFLREHAP